MKVAAARAALDEVHSGMSLGLGTGSTAEEFVRLLGDAVASGKLRDLRCTCTSNKTEAQARSLGIAISDLAKIAPLDLAVDGADEIDSKIRLIKGRGGALLREKIVEQSARRFIVIADDSKLVGRLGVGVLPVEVTPFALEVLQRVTTVPVEPRILLRASEPFPTLLGTLDAVHLATALLIRDDLEDLSFATHDDELALAARAVGFRVHGVPTSR